MWRTSEVKRLGVDECESECVQCVNVKSECKRERWDTRETFGKSPVRKSARQSWWYLLS